MARIVKVECARCGHPEAYVVESNASDEEIAVAIRAPSDCVTTADDASVAAEKRLQRLKSLPTSLPVGGIITPV